MFEGVLSGGGLLDMCARRLLLYEFVFGVFETIGVGSCRLVAQG